MAKIHLIYDKGDWQPEERHNLMACGLDWDYVKDWTPGGVDVTTDESKVTCKNCIKCINGEREYAGW